MKTYKILITPHVIEGEQSQIIERPYTIDLTTDDINWSMEQYQRNRETFTWEILEVNEYDV
tara:strand:- start:646 stop:828 length:183 start_codon:yes stop_codon:yes gene_type:complete